jgi:hypothetical protein
MLEEFRGPVDPDELVTETSLSQREVRRTRRHRALTVPSSGLLAICLALPLFSQCGHPVYPIQLPPLWGPYLFGVVFGLAALSPRVRSYALGLKIIVWATLLGMGFLFAIGGVGQILAIALAVWMALATLGDRSERTVARIGLAAGVSFAAWFGALSLDKDAMLGAFVSAIASIGVALGSLWWWFESS